MFMVVEEDEQQKKQNEKNYKEEADIEGVIMEFGASVVAN